MPLMDRIYCESFLDMNYHDQMNLIEKLRTVRSSALNAAKVSSKRLTKSAMKNIAKKKTGGRKRKPKDHTKAAQKALSKLSPEQIALIASKLKGQP